MAAAIYFTLFLVLVSGNKLIWSIVLLREYLRASAITRLYTSSAKFPLSFQKLPSVPHLQ
jgi:hypothetical protein